jgi:hypothetical protein
MRSTRLRWALGALLGMSGLAAFAGDPPSQNAEVWCDVWAELGVCDDAAWSGVQRTTATILQDAVDSSFVQLEQRLSHNNLESANDEFTRETASYLALDLIARDALVGASESLVEQWSAAVPASPFIVMIRAMRLKAKALRLMGRVPLDAAPTETRELYLSLLADARKLMASVAKGNREGLTWQVLDLELQACSGDGGVANVLSSMHRKWPQSSLVYTAPAACDARRGDWAAFDNIAASAVRDTSKTAGMTYYARLYAPFGSHIANRRTNLDWPLMKQGFGDWLKGWPTDRVRNLYAAYACMYDDKDAFRKAMPAPRAEAIRRKLWFPGHSYEACVAWASVPS